MPTNARTPAPHISTVRSTIQEATSDTTELGDLLAAALAAADQQCAATGRGANDSGDR